jgi:hypothetical protein
MEYQLLKEEQRARIGVRDNLIYATLTVFAAVIVFAFGGGAARYPALLVLPPACLVLGWTYLTNDRKVSSIRRYIGTELVVTLSGGAAAHRGLLGWEVWHRHDPHRRRRKIIQLFIDLTTFCVAGGGAVVTYWMVAPAVPPLLIVVGGVEMLGLCLLGAEIIRDAETSGGS